MISFDLIEITYIIFISLFVDDSVLVANNNKKGIQEIPFDNWDFSNHACLFPSPYLIMK